MSGEDEKFDRAALFIGPRFERSARRLPADGPQVGLRVVHAVLQLAQPSVVIVKPLAAADFDRIV